METKLFCLPYAGGSSNVYMRWKRALPPYVQVHPLELPGRGARINERPYKRMEEAIDDLYGQLVAETDKPFAFFGHSMGSTLVFELLHRLQAEGREQPLLAVVSGRTAPGHPLDKIRHTLTDEAFIEELVTIGGTPQVLVENKALLQLYLPTIRADMELLETYKPDGSRPLFSCPLLVLNGKRDPYTNAAGMSAWQSCTSGACEQAEFDGGHFFIHEQQEAIVRLISKQIDARRLG